MFVWNEVNDAVADDAVGTGVGKRGNRGYAGFDESDIAGIGRFVSIEVGKG